MELTKQAIQKHKQDIEGLEGYITVINKIENNVSVNPDIAIESCKSLIEGLCKKALELLSEEYQTKKNVRKDCDNSLPTLVRKAFENVYKNSFEIAIHNALYTTIKDKVKLEKIIKISLENNFQNISKAIIKTSLIRDKRGDISHGRIYPKKEESEIHLAKSITSITDGICSFMIYEFASQYVALDKKIEKLNFEREKGFNEWLDTKYDIVSVKIDYSKILFKNAYEKYEELYYSEYLVSIEEEIIEDTVEEIIIEEPIEIIEPIEKLPIVSENEPKEVIQLTNNFNEKTFWTENKIQELNKFADTNAFYVDGLKKIIENYIAFDDEPRRDVIAPIMKYPPSLADRRTVLLVMLEEVMGFANDLKEK